MTRLTYTHSREFRTGQATLIGLLMLESPLWLGLAWILHDPWRLIPLGVLGFGAVMLLIIMVGLSGPHRLDSETLTLRVGLGTTSIPVGKISGVCRFPGWVEIPFGGRLTRYVAAEDALVVASASRGLVEITLTEPCTAKVPRQGECSFSRILLYVDDPGPLLALSPEALPVVEVVTAAPVTPLPSHAAHGGLVAHGLTKRYGGFTAVDGLSLTVGPGEVVALLGANGAGKSTTLGMLTGLTRPNAGTVSMDGHDVWAEPLQARAVFGYVPDTPLFHESLTGREFLEFLGDLYGLPPAEARARAAELLEQMRLSNRADTWALGYSLGMRRKLSIAAGLIHRPQILLLDEVTNGLDPRANREVVDLIAGLAVGGTSVLLATHVLAVAEELAHRIAVLHEGRLRAIGTLEELRAAAHLSPTATLEQVFLGLTGGEAA